MDNIWIIAIITLCMVLLGVGFRIFNLKWKNKAVSAKMDAEIKSEQMAATISASLDGIIVIDIDGNIVEFSESAERIFGYKRNDIIGRNMATLIVPERYRAAHNKGMARMRDTGEVKILGQRIEIEALRANGEEFISELAISRSRSSSGDIFIAYIRDITTAKAAEKALLDAKEAAELANRAKTQFISAMSHEIRTPFNAVLGIFDILGESELTLDQQQLIETAERTSRSLLRIINDVLDYARISSGSVKVINEAFYGPDIFEDINRLFTVQAEDQNTILNINTENVPDIYLLGDVGRIRQILMNFVSNALKYTKNGRVELIAETMVYDDGKVDLICKVKDNGQGIKADKVNHLFDEFYMAEDVDTRASEGTGLGLTICKVLCRLMGGKIGVESEYGKGSVFWINIPLEQTQAVNMVVQPDLPEASIKDIKILLTEDNATNRMVVSRALKKRGAILTVTTNGVEALNELENHNFDVLLTDVFMPDMGGKELVQRLRAEKTLNKTIPVIALTAMGDKQEAAELKKYGIDQVILKPFEAKDLVNAIAQQCAGGTSREELSKMPSMKLSGGLLEGLDAEDLMDIKGQFELDLQELTSALRVAIAANDIGVTKSTSHTLKGLAGVYGFSELSQAAALTNSYCADDKMDQMLKHGKQAIKIAEFYLTNLDEIFKNLEEAA